jgi:hypothetical protein
MRALMRPMEIEMEKKIASLKAAYAKNDRAAIVRASRALIAYNNKHPMAVLLTAGSEDIVNLARKIVAIA